MSDEKEKPAKLAYSLSEVCEVIGISPRSLAYLRERGEIEARKIGSRTIILAEELKRFLSNLPVAEKVAA